MFNQIDYVIVMVSDMARSIHFYRDLLGFAVKSESKEWTELKTGSTTLALHPARKPADRESGAAGEPQPGTCGLGFSVANLDETCATLKSRGITFVMPPTQRPGEGIRLAVAIDPDGLSISFAQSL